MNKKCKGEHGETAQKEGGLPVLETFLMSNLGAET